MNYNKISKGYDELYGEEQIKKAKLILENIKIKKTDLLLDVGCGTGISTELFNCKKTGIDPSEELIKQAKKRISAGVGKGEELPFENNYFDIVICITAIHNFNDFKKGISEMKRVCKTNENFDKPSNSQNSQKELCLKNTKKNSYSKFSNGKIIITILKKSKKLNEIKTEIEKELFVKKEIEEEKDIILICGKDF